MHSHPHAPRLKRLRTLALLALVLISNSLWANTEVRVLIDVSGSMRQNDPQNLRVPALRLVNELLPAGTQAGVWLFAEKTELLAPPGTVDAAWKRKTSARLERIHSRGLLTDIEQAIKTAVSGWDGPAGKDDERHLVLLTDGLVDVSKDAGENATSRERIVKEQLEQLKALGVQVHTVALSDKVDMALMGLLSKETGGWLETAQSADALQRVFLHMLEQTAAPTTVPLKANRFEIDDQVSEFTLLAFRAEGAETLLISPSGQRISAKQLPKGAAWRSEAGYDLVTLSSPEAGTWQLKGVQDPDNRVVVVTALDIATSALPGALSASERPKIETWLTDHQQPLVRKDLLRLLTASVEVSRAAASEPGQREDGAAADTDQPPSAAPADAPSAIKMPLDTKSGRFVTELDTEGLAPGAYELRLLIDGGTFKRQTIKHFKVTGTPITIAYDQQLPSEEDPSARIALTLSCEPDLIDPEGVLGYLLIQGPDGKDSVVEIPASVRLPLAIKVPVQRPGDYLIKSQFIARTLGGESIRVQPEPHRMTFDFPRPDEPSQETEDGAPKPPIRWLALGGYLLGGNLLLGGVLGLTWWLLQHPKAAGGTVPGETSEKTAAKGKTVKGTRS
ncbi:hypothetical protein CKO23_13980 [Thiocystis violacea]|nr:hypothetical protein [Thiocystis violacea]